MQVEGTPGLCKDIDVRALAIAVFKDEKAEEGFLKELDALTRGVIKSVIDSEELKGKEGETVYLHLLGAEGLKAQRLLLVGVGERAEYTIAQVSQMAGLPRVSCEARMSNRLRWCRDQKRIRKPSRQPLCREPSSVCLSPISTGR